MHEKQRGLKSVHAAFFLVVDASEALLSSSTYITNDNDGKSKAPLDPSVYILDAGLCRSLSSNNLSVLPFNIFQQLTSLTSL